MALRDWLAAAGLFLATAGVILWQNAHIAVLWDLSYILDTAGRIALGQLPYRDFPLAHPPLTFLIQAAIIRLTGRVFFHHVLYAAAVGGLGTVLTWRIVLHSLRERLVSAWAVALLLAVPLTVLGIYCILPTPSYDCDCAFSILVSIWLLQRLWPDGEVPGRTWPVVRGFLAGAGICVPLFFKQNIGLPFLAAALVAVGLLLGAGLIRRGKPRLDGAGKELNPSEKPEEPASGTKAREDFSGSDAGVNTPAYQSRLPAQTSFSAVCSARPEIRSLLAVLAGAAVAFLVAVLLIQFTVGLGNYFYWTIQFAAQRRLPGFQDMLGVYRDSQLLWTLPCILAALILLRNRLAKARWAQIAAVGLLAAPFLFTLYSLILYDDADERGDALLALWPLLLILTAALALFNLYKHRRSLTLRALLPIILLVTVNGAFMSQQLWGSTYAIWPLLMVLIAEMIAFLAAPSRAAKESGNSRDVGETGSTLALVIAAVISTTLLICGGFYTASEERLSYVQIPDGPVAHSTFPQLAGMATPGPYLADFDELLHYASAHIPSGDGLILIPGEDPFYFVTGRKPQFPVLLFDPATDPYSPAQVFEEARLHHIRWLIVKRELQIKEDPTPQREATLKALMTEFTFDAQLCGYTLYRRR